MRWQYKSVSLEGSNSAQDDMMRSRINIALGLNLQMQLAGYCWNRILDWQYHPKQSCILIQLFLNSLTVLICMHTRLVPTKWLLKVSEHFSFLNCLQNHVDRIHRYHKCTSYIKAETDQSIETVTMVTVKYNFTIVGIHWTGVGLLAFPCISSLLNLDSHSNTYICQGLIPHYAYSVFSLLPLNFHLKHLLGFLLQVGSDDGLHFNSASTCITI